MTSNLDAQVIKVMRVLDRLIRRQDCVLTYDESLVEQLPDILREQRGISTDADLARDLDVVALFGLLSQGPPAGWRLADLPAVVEKSGVPLERYAVVGALAQKTVGEFAHWSEKRADQDLDTVLTLQTDLGMGQHRPELQRYAPQRQIGELRNYLRSVTTAPATLIERLLRPRTGNCASRHGNAGAWWLVLGLLCP